jgi:hypothetical protein
VRGPRGRAARGLRRLVTGEPARHQRGDELYRGLHHVRREGDREPRRPQQRGRVPAPADHGATRLHPQRAAPGAGRGPACHRPCPTPSRARSDRPCPIG